MKKEIMRNASTKHHKQVVKHTQKTAKDLQNTVKNLDGKKVNV
jgi:hypothetical protein